MYNMDTQPDNNGAVPSESPIRHNPNVAVGFFSDGVKAIWIGLILNLAGLYPLFILLDTLDNPRHMTTVGSWILVSPALFAGIITLAFGLKEKGYQEKTVRILGISVFFVSIALFLIPLVASLMYASGIGN
jgi:hypothetical protein